MPRANRYLLDGQLYHVTHRCHDREFLLRFATDRNDYRHEIDDRIQRGALDREAQWSEAVTVGTDAFIDSITQQLPDRRRWEIRAIDIGPTTGRILKEPTPPYMVFSAAKNASKDDYGSSD